MVSAPLVLALEERRRQALLAGDLPALQGLLADDLVYVHSTGTCDGKATYLAKLSGGSLKYLELNFSDLQVQSLQQAAVVSGRMAAVVSKDGQRKNVASLFMTVWGSGADGAWRLHAHQGTPLPAA
jgi:ketosteroid isomerase-like protein